MLTADQAVALAERDQAEIGSSTLYSAKLVTYGDLLGTGGVLDAVPPARSATETVWAVTFAGGVTPNQGVLPQRPYDWACLLIDPATGAPAGMVSKDGQIPSWLAP